MAEPIKCSLLEKTPSINDTNKQDKLVGTQGQIVGFDTNGNAQAQDANYLPLTGGTVTGRVVIKNSHGEVALDSDGITLFNYNGQGAYFEGDYVNDSPHILFAGTENDEPVLLSGVAAPPSEYYAANKQYVDQQRPKFVSVTIPTSGTWAQGTAADGTVSWSQTVTVTGVLAGADAKQKVTPWPADQTSWAAWGNAGLRCFIWGENSLTFTADTIPTVDINLNIELQVIQ